MTWTLVLATWGALVGTLSLAWNIFHAVWRDRGRLRVTASFQHYWDPTLPEEDPDSHGTNLTVRMVNAGRRPIRPVSLQVVSQTGRNRTHTIACDPGRPLAEAETHDAVWPSFEYAFRASVCEISVMDSLQDRWYVEKSEIERLRQQFEKLRPVLEAREEAQRERHPPEDYEDR